MDKRATQLAQHGRYGDDRLIHVSQAEIDGIASLVPGGKLPINPKTGLPEAFIFSLFPMLMGGLGAAAAPAAAGAAAAGTAAAAAPALAATGALGSGVAAGMEAATMATPALASMTAPAVASTAPMVAPATLSGGGGLSTLIGSAGADTLAGPAIGSQLAPAVPAGASPGLLTPPASAQGIGALGPATAPPAKPIAPLGPSGFRTAPATAIVNGQSMPASALTGQGAAQKSGLLGGLGGLDAGKMLQYGALAAMMMPRGGGGKEDKEYDVDVEDFQYEGGSPAAAPPGYRPGIDPEHRFYPFKKGGLVKRKGYAEGGLATLQADQASSKMDDEALLNATVEALRFGGPDAAQVIQMFVSVFGEAALQDLMMKMQSMGQSDGQSDSIPASLEGSPAALSEGEYVIPSDVVSDLGNGSTDAGGRMLDEMGQRVRSERGRPMAPPRIDPMSVMP